MVITAFPPIESADESGLLAVGGDLEVESLLLAYSSGIFPWPIVDDSTLTWFCPPERAVLFLSEFKVSRRLRREKARTTYAYSFNAAFPEVIEECALSKNRTGQDGTWITEHLRRAYNDFHRAGYAFSVECRDGGALAGGLYGVAIGEMVAGESLFYRASNASKLCLWCLVDYLKSLGVQWIDCQQMTPLLRSFGARCIPRDEFLLMVRAAAVKGSELFAFGSRPTENWRVCE